MFGITVLATVPAVLLAGMIGIRWSDAEREALHDRLARRSESLSMRVERHLMEAESALTAIALSSDIRQSDLAQAHEHARRFLDHPQAFGNVVVLMDTTGHQFFNTLRPFGSELPDAPTSRSTDSTGTHADVSDLYVSRVTGRPQLAIDLPVRREGHNQILRMGIEPSSLSAVLREEQLPEGWIGVLLDRTGTIIARTAGEAEYVGQKGVPQLLHAIARGEKGWYDVVVKEGTEMRAAFHRLPSTGWTVAVGVPVEELRAPLVKSLRSVALGGSFLLAVGFAAAWLLARRLEGQVDAICASAHALGKGEKVIAPRSTVSELAILGRELEVAGALLGTREEEREAQWRAAKAAEAEALRANQAKSRFLAAAGHDLRQPFQAMRLFLEVLRPHVAPSGIQPFDRLEEAMHSGEILLSALMDISVLDAGTVQVSRQTFPVGEAIARIAAEIEPQAAENGLSVRTLPCSARVESDPVMLERMLRNLAVNAIRYTEKGGVLIGCRRRNGRVLIEVWDTGIGIPEDQLPHLFEEFYQVANDSRDRAKGLGLGLAVVAKTARLLGHEVEVRSRPGRGSVFCILLDEAR